MRPPEIDLAANPPGDSLDRLLGLVEPSIASILDRALEGKDISVDEATVLFDTSGRELNALVMVADELRR